MFVQWDLHGMTQRIWEGMPASPFDAAALLATMLLVCISLYLLFELESMRRIHRRKFRDYWRGMPMSVHREVEMISDAITDALEDLYYQGKITKKVRDRWYARLSSEHALADLVPRRKKVCKERAKYIKDQIMYRVMLLKKAAKPKLPDESFIVIKSPPRRGIGKAK